MSRPITNRKKSKLYFKAREIEGKSQAESLIAGDMNPNTFHGTRVEGSKTYEKLKEKYADVLKDKISFDALADLQIRNAEQDKDKGASNKALDSILGRLAPTESAEFEASDVIIKVTKK